MIGNDSIFGSESSEKFICHYCDYKTCRKSQYERHLSTDKHKNELNDSKMIGNDSDLVLKSSKLYHCLCGKVYKYDSGYYRHKKVCSFEKQTFCENQLTNLVSDKDLIMMLV